ncbi:MAG: sulfotransferase family 2 domain-containing protein [Pseudomonadota bacterium]
MIISPGRKYIFVHIPKTGGTSMALMLEGRAMKDDLLIGDTPKARRRKRRLADLRPAGRLWKHSSLADIVGVVSLEDMYDCFVFTMVRNPWDRLVSYYYWLRGQSFSHPAVGMAKVLTFGDFVLDPATQDSFAKAPFGSYLTVDGRDYGSHYIRLEHLAEDMTPLATHLGMRLPALTQENRSERTADWRPYYTDLTAEAVARFAATDIARFGYGFDDFGREKS